MLAACGPICRDENHDKVDRIIENFFKCCKNLKNTSYGP